MSDTTTKTVREFTYYVDREIKTVKPYRHLVIEALLKSYPSNLTKKIISDHIRVSVNTKEYFEYFSIWSPLIEKDKLIIEEGDGFRLNVVTLSEDEKQRLLRICAKRIVNMESDYKQNETSTATQSFTKNTESQQQESSRTKTGHYLIHFKNNTMKYQNQVKYEDIQNHNLNLSRRLIKHFKINENQKNVAIIYDVKANQIRVWGQVEMIQKSQTSRTAPNIILQNFQPLIEKDEKIIPKWLLKQDIRNSMFGNKPIDHIDQIDFDRILKTAVTQEMLLQIENTADQLTKITKENLDEYISKQKITNIKKETLEEEKEKIKAPSYSNDELLEIPNKDNLEKGIIEIQKSLLIDRKTIEEIIIHLTSGRHILLAGAIGTGKTHLASKISELFWSNEKNGYDSKVYTASYEWDITDVIGGIVPRMKNNSPSYEIQYGCISETVKQSWKDKENVGVHGEKYRGTWLIIDEFNRAEIDKAFGQLFTSLESRVLQIPDPIMPTLMNLPIPKDYRIIGTLNTSDKHHLFQLSDALKRRFAFVEIKSPTRKEANHEIYYALSGALEELSPVIASLIKLNRNERIIDENQPNEELINAILNAYEILSFVRITKDMGTAVLKTIYQTVLTGTQIKGYDDSILDIALNGNIIPQLEKVDAVDIEILLKFCFSDVHNFFRKMYDAPDEEVRQKYEDGFERYLKFLEVSDTDELKKKYGKKSIEDKHWTMIIEKWNIQKVKNNSNRDLPLFKTALEDLKKTFEFL